jgi:hypothetical protein
MSTIPWPKGKTRITLSKGDRNQLRSARELCGNVAKLVDGHVQRAALTAESGLAVILAEFPAEAAEAKAEPPASQEPASPLSGEQSNKRARTP